MQAVTLALMGCDFLQLAENCAGELVKRKNSTSFMYDGWDWPEEGVYEEHTKWSDVNIAQPVLFSFYHGIELTLKSLLLAKKIDYGKIHKLSKLLDSVESNYGNIDILEFYFKYIRVDRLHRILADFCKNSGVDMDMYYQSLKYPSSTKGGKFEHSVLRYNGEEGCELFGDIEKDVLDFKNKLKNTVATEIKLVSPVLV